MTHGKKVCKILKEIRRQIAEENDIALVTAECHYKGECKGTCPRCEAEVRFLENELNKRRQLGKAVAIAGISLGMAGGFTECFNPQKNDIENPNTNITTDSVTPLTPLVDTSDVLISNENSNNEVLIDTITLPGIVGFILDDDFDLHNPHPDVLRFVEEMPEPIGGFDSMYNFISSELNFLEIDRDHLISGKAFVEFIVEKDGSISNVQVLTSDNPDVNYEVIRVVKMMPPWKPGKQNGELVRCFYTIPIKFTLDDK